MKRAGLTFFAVLLLSVFAKAQNLLGLRVDFAVQNEALPDALVQLSLQSDIPISFSESFLPEKTVSVRFEQSPIRSILDNLLKDCFVDYKIVNEGIIIFETAPPPPKKFTISGYVEDASTGERLIAATVYDLRSGRGTITNEYGFFSLSIAEGMVQINCSYLGYQANEYTFTLDQDQQFSFSLDPSLTLTEVIVTAPDTISIQAPLNDKRNEIPLDFLTAMPQLGGEGDVLRFTHMMAGVQTGADGVGGIHVRGGSADQNLILLDGVPVYNASHAVGVFSTFNSSAVRSARLIKGDFPARYAGRLSSVLDIRTREGNQKNFAAEAQAGFVGGRLTLEGPIVKDKGAIFVAGRLAYLNFWLRPYLRGVKEDRNGEGNSDYGFFDVNAKINYSITPKDKVYLSLYRGGDDYFDESFNRDTFELKTNDVRYSDTLQQDLKWGNTIGALRWNRTWNENLFSNLSLTFSDYRFTSIDFSKLNDFELPSNLLLSRDVSYQQFQSNIEDQAAKIDFEYAPKSNHRFFFGASFTRHKFQPGVLTINEDPDLLQIDNDTIFQNAANISYESGLYLEDFIQINDRWTVNLGFHFAGLDVEDTIYWSLQPRFSSRYEFSKSTAISLAAGRMTQYLHLLTDSDFGLPTDLWVPSTARVKPEDAWQVDFGLEQELLPGLELSWNIYYKSLSNLLTFQTGNSLAFIDANNWEDKVAVGTGESYGMEWQIRKFKGRTKAMLNYSLAWAERKFESINNGEAYPFKYNRRHDLKIVLSHRFTENFELSANWVFGTGLAFTLATSSFEFTQGPDFIAYNIFQVGEKNALRLPNYHRMDFGLNWYKNYDTGNLIIHLGVYNFYNRKNPLYYRLGRDPDDFLRRRFVQVNILPAFPTLSLTYKFNPGKLKYAEN